MVLISFIGPARRFALLYDGTTDEYVVTDATEPEARRFPTEAAARSYIAAALTPAR